MLLIPLYSSNKNEQFYKIIRPLALLLKFLGFFPFQNVSCNDGLKLDHDKFSAYIHLLLATIAYTVPSIWQALNADNNFMMFSEIMVTAFIIMLIFNCFFTDDLLLEIIHKFEKYDKLFIKSHDSVSSKRFKYRGFICFIIISFAITVKTTFVDYMREYRGITLLNKTFQFVWMYLAQNAVWWVMFSGFYALLCYELSLRFEELRLSITNNMSLKRIEEVRLMHGKLKDINGTINSCFGFRVSLFCLYFLYSFIHLFYKMVVETKNITPWTFIAEVKKFISLYMTCYSSEFAVIQNKHLMRYLQALPKYKMTPACKFQIELLICEAESSSFTITAWGLFKVDREMYATVFVVVVTYIITVLQIPEEYNIYLLKKHS